MVFQVGYYLSLLLCLPKGCDSQKTMPLFDPKVLVKVIVTLNVRQGVDLAKVSVVGILLLQIPQLMSTL